MANWYKKFLEKIKVHKRKTKKIWVNETEYNDVPLKFFTTKKKDQLGKKMMAAKSAKRTQGYYDALKKEQ